MSVEAKTFTTEDCGVLIVVSAGNNIIFFTDDDDTEDRDFIFNFDSVDFKSLYVYLTNLSFMKWPGFFPKIANSSSSDYDEYYDKELDNNGYMEIRKNRLDIARPSPESTRLYVFTKAKMQSFLFDLDRMVRG
ncbi:MAG: hypothetical protein ABS894_00860 [Aerococcus urinaeequi]